jgi:proline dehydrogenase
VRERYRELALPLLLHGTYPAFATHDESLVDAVRAAATANAVPSSAFEFQMLYGARPELQRRLVAAGYRVRVYVPYGTFWAKYFRRRVTERRENLLFAVGSLIRK